jgi:phospholipid/cholesterol/gamma-HCH transport system substrate-binding protein
MTTKRERTLIVGAFVAGTGVILAIALLWIAGARFFRPVARYAVIFNGSVSGLATGAPVQLNGVQVGRVVDIDLTDDVPPQVEVDIEVKPRTPIQRNTIARLSGNIVTGIRYIELSGGTAQAGVLQEDGKLSGDQQSLADLQAQASEVTQETYDLIASLKHDTLNHQNRIALGDMIQNMSVVSKNLRLVTDRIAAKNRLDELDQTMSNINDASAEIKEAARHANGALERIQDRAGATFQNFNNTLDKMNMTLASTQIMINSANSLIDRNTFHIDHALLNIDRISQHLDETIQTIQSDPSVMVWGSRVSDRELAK